METLIERLYKGINDSALLLKEALGLSYIEAYIETAENILDGRTTRVIDGQPDEGTAGRLNDIYSHLELEIASPEEIRRANQFVLLKAAQDDYIQANHRVTPDLVGQIMAYLSLLFIDKEEELHLVDFGVGTGNLLTTVMNELQSEGVHIKATGIDVDDLLLSAAIVNSSMQGHQDIQFIKQDTLTNLFIEPADIAISDLPVGYYPDDEQAENFNLSFDEGHSYAHFLFIEQALNYLKENGLAFFVVPSAIFQDEKAKSLIQYTHEIGFFQAIIQLPRNFFKNEQSQQSIVLIQKKGSRARQAKEVLIARAPDFTQKEKVFSFFNDIAVWKDQNF